MSPMQRHHSWKQRVQEECGEERDTVERLLGKDVRKIWTSFICSQSRAFHRPSSTARSAARAIEYEESAPAAICAAPSPAMEHVASAPVVTYTETYSAREYLAPGEEPPNKRRRIR